MLRLELERGRDGDSDDRSARAGLRLGSTHEHLATGADLSQLRGEVSAELAEWRAELAEWRTELLAVETRLTRWMLAITVGLTGSVLAVGIAAVMRLG